MLRIGMTIKAAKKRMEKSIWWEISKEQAFDSGEVNIHYSNGGDKLTLFFDKNKRLAKIMLCEC